ncbi:MAG: AMP-binding protein, partial [Acidobacteria bacterium]|nr:AMP-binding protein [Acidobacteriota bacterium]
IQVRGACVFAGYFDDEPQSRATLRGGWLHTGDIGCLDESGRLFVKGRARSLIKRGGAALAPKEIEEVVDGIPEVRLSAALGLAGLEFAVEERLVIVAELRGESVSYPADAAALTSRIAQHVAQRFGVMPFQVLLVEPGGIPLTASGKVQHAEVSARLRSGRLAELFFTD